MAEKCSRCSARLKEADIREFLVLRLAVIVHPGNFT